MLLENMNFRASYQKVADCPISSLPEYAFIGRSNVGKSSLINMLTGIKSLAKVSNTPGKTKLINLFSINDVWQMVDLPGYGYARVSKKDRGTFSAMIQGYLLKRENLSALFVLIDSRLIPQKIDLEFLDFCGQNNVPLAIIFTKSDKIKKMQLQSNISLFLDEVKHRWNNLPPHFITSAENKTGREEVLTFIAKTNKVFLQHANS